MATDTPIVDTDSHCIEPADLFTDRVSGKWGDLIPRVVWNDDFQADVWYIGDRPLMKAWSSATRGYAAGLDVGPACLEDVDPSCYVVEERVKGMDAQGIAVEVLYPNLGIAGNLVPEHSVELSFELVRAHNDWLLDWISFAPSRFVPLALIPYWDVGESVKEIERAAGLGHKGIVMTGAPFHHGLQPIASRSWDPLWAAAQAHHMPISFHIASAKVDGYEQAYIDVEGAATTNARASLWTYLENGKHVTELIMSGVLARYPQLRFITVESGIGWIPFILEGCDHFYRKGTIVPEHPEMELLPSAYFKRQVYANYWFERLGDHHLEHIGVDRILFETDFPHPTCLVGDQIRQAIDNGLGHRTQEVRDRILWKNAAELFGIELAGGGDDRDPAGAPGCEPSEERAVRP
jgi:predicted TIM-barrel fold metal-dependent hydrolase